jgi:hypothetical protein
LETPKQSTLAFALQIIVESAKALDVEMVQLGSIELIEQEKQLCGILGTAKIQSSTEFITLSPGDLPVEAVGYNVLAEDSIESTSDAVGV